MTTEPVLPDSLSDLEAEPEIDYTTMTAQDFATEYARDMAQVVSSAGKAVVIGMFVLAGLSQKSPRAQARMGAALDGRARAWTENLSEDIAAALVESIRTDARPKETVAKIDQMSESKSKIIARTELEYAREAANVEIMDSMGYDRVEYVATMDDRTCEECGALHGQVFMIQSAPELPIHPNCRCTYVPYFEGG